MTAPLHPNPAWAKLPLFDRKGWQKVRFGDVTENLNETCVPTEAGIERYIGLEHLEPGSLHIRSWGNVADGVTFNRRCKPGQVLFGKRRAYQRKVAMAEFDAVVSGDIYVFAAKKDRLVPELLPFLCMSDRFFSYAVETSAGSLSPRTNWSSLADFEFALPPLDQQRRMAEILWAADEAITEAAEAVNNFEKLLSLRWKQLTIENKAAQKPLSEFADFINGDAYKPSDWKQKGIPIIRIQNLNGSQEFNFTIRPSSECVLVAPGEMLFGWSGNRGTSFGPFIWQGSQGALNQHIFLVKEYEQTDRFFLYMALKVMTPAFEDRAHGSAGLVHIKKGVLLGFTLPMPTKMEQEEIGITGRKMEAIIQLLRNNLDNLVHFRGALINETSRI